MKVKYKGTSYNVPDDEIERLMGTLNLTKIEAVKTYLFDNDLISDETADVLTEKAKGITGTIHAAGDGTKKPRKREDKEKEELISTLLVAVKEIDENAKILNPTRLIGFTKGGSRFEIMLTRKKEKKSGE